MRSSVRGHANVQGFVHTGCVLAFHLCYFETYNSNFDMLLVKSMSILKT